MGKVKIYYFSPTGSTRQVAQHLGELLGAGTCHKIDFVGSLFIATKEEDAKNLASSVYEILSFSAQGR